MFFDFMELQATVKALIPNGPALTAGAVVSFLRTIMPFNEQDEDSRLYLARRLL